MASTDMGVTETVAVAHAQIADDIQMYLQERSVLMDKVMVRSVVKGDKSIAIGRAGGFTVGTKTENTALATQLITYSADTLTLDQHKAILVRLEKIANLQARPDIVADIIMRMGLDMAYNIDTYLVTKLILASASTPDHRIAYANSASLGKADILSARTLLRVQNIQLNECFIGVSPASESNLLAIDDFVHADKYGSSDGLVKGEIGRLYGAKVICSNAFADAATVVWHPTAVAFALQQAPDFDEDKDLDNIGTKYLCDTIYGAALLDSGKRQVLLGSAT